MKTRLLNFQARFAPLVEAGVKPHTIRKLRVDGRDPLPGDLLRLYTGLRSKSVRLLREEVCDYAAEVVIQPSVGNVHNILLCGKPLDQQEIDQLAINDGFASAAAMVHFFEEEHGLPFTGLLIGWQPTPAYVTRH